MKKIIISVLALLSLAVQAEELSTFNQVAAAVSQGNSVNFVIHIQECLSEKALPNITVSITPNAVMIIANNRITASDRHFTLDAPMARGNPIWEYSKFNIDSEGGASVKSTTMNALTYEILDTRMISCQLGKGFKVFSGASGG